MNEDEQIFSHSDPLKIRLEFECTPDFHSIHALFGLLAGRKLEFPASDDTAIEFEMLYVGELGVLLAGIEDNSTEMSSYLPRFRWLNNKEVLLITFEDVR